MGNRKVSLMWYARTPRGWRRFPVVLGKNNRVRHAHVVDKGEEKVYPDGRYELLSYEGRKPVYKRAGDNPADALAMRDREASLIIVKSSAVAAGAKIVEEEQRKYIRKYAKLYVEDCENNRKMEAAVVADLVMKQFMEVCRKTFVDEIVKDDIYRFHRAMRARGNGEHTIANKHARLKSFLKFCKVDTDAVMPPAPKYEKTLPTIYTREQTRAILEVADGEMKLVIELGLKLGLREQEIMYAEWNDINWQNNTFRVQRKAHWNFEIKDYEQRELPCPSDLLARLKDWRKEHPASRLIVPTATGTPNQKLLRTLKRSARRSGLNCGECKGCKSKWKECRRWTLHHLRRTYGTTLLRNGFDATTVQHMMGHADLATTMRYLRPESGEATQDRINAIAWV